MADTTQISNNQPQQLFVRADEIDAGTSILSPSTQLPLSALNPPDSSASLGTARPKPPARPGLRREGSSVPPPPPSQPPPAPPPGDVTDSLSLPQLRQLVNQFPKSEQRAYAFQYKEAEDFEKEVDEWFQYTEPEQEREYLLASREAFEQKWKVYCQHQLHTDDVSWLEVAQDVRQKFTRGLIPDLEGSDMNERIEALGCIYYILTGTWSITSGLDASQCTDSFKDSISTSPNQYNAVQLEWMHRGADLVLQSSLTAPLFGCLFTAAKPASTRDVHEEAQDLADQTFDDNEYRELSLCYSCFYLLIESARARVNRPGGQRIRQELTALSPSFLLFLTSTISRLRWDESYNVPLIHAIQLLWKSILLFFGDIQHDLEDVRSMLQPRVDPFSTEASHPVLTASPLDYHLFRQEITSKYPSYNPPLPLIPLEVEQKSIIPLMPQHSSRHTPPNGAATTNIGSILHQPVHIATPAPSPPPSPMGPGGKGGKKQNYQTNQNFPFLYPPLDSSSNDLGGKGNTELQDMMVGKKWEGSDVPTSVIEAGELFASRMRMTRAMRQLWKQRELFMKYDRGWGGEEGSKSQNDREDHAQPQMDDDDLEGLANPSLRVRMHAVDHFFHHALPDMQSLVIVLMKVMLSNVQDIAIRNGNVTDASQPSSGLNRTKSNSNVTAQTLPMPPPPPKPTDMSIEDLDNIRSREISQKAISATLFLLLKWFKISHILKFEYFTQLLLDSNYVQLTLKYFAHQNLEDLVAFKYDRDDLSFFHYCHLHSDHPPLSPTSPNSNSHSSGSDDAIPPPIPRHRRSSGTTSDNAHHPDNAQQPDLPHPTVDELGNPTSPTSYPASPIQTFSFRQFHTSIHLLRTLQKLTRHKSHRILLLVQFKSSQILRRILRVPEPTLRLYVLKLFKSQVPYCGRKWRQSNMRVITAIYLHCRPELRDEWLAGMHESSVEGEVEDSVPIEWAGRGLTFWWLKRRYPEQMRLRDQKAASSGSSTNNPIGSNNDNGEEGEEWQQAGGAGQEIEDEERDFFQRELDQLGWGLAALNTGGEDVAFGEEAPGVANANGGNLSMNGGDMQGHWEAANAATLEAWQSQER